MTDVVTLTMTAAQNRVTITKQPSDVTVAAGEMAVVIVEATGDGLTYEWYYKNAGASKFSKTTSFAGNTYSVEMNSSCDGRQIHCVITDQYVNKGTTNAGVLDVST